ncbi:cobaltochelatase subunit CobN [Microvirga lotononidis]|uniref:Mg chelatase, cobalamin biosynthesis protein CobN n=1 Tax=Microvirga lotononidis TaxID=864069 RepID=I4YWU0_9HYPH|nr:cobaltochelatase subunit CobN [Microvirga lotononidis]EIM28432.1 Mg chelatase, cobalamin biosynthesis protein CobN [Microvirga lotononidis]WQO27488.1 cobaltochelatase subunit CobN [Microvirga lotononidis]
MHLLPVTAISLDEGSEATDLQQPPGDIVVLSFADSDLGALAAAQRLTTGGASLRLASLRRLRHPLSVDLYSEKTASKARFVLVRCLGGLDYWRYGIEHLSRICSSHGVKLAVLPGDDRPDPRLAAYSTVPQALCDELEAYFQAGGMDNMRRLLARIGAEIGETGTIAEPPRNVPRAFAWLTRDSEQCTRSENAPDQSFPVMSWPASCRPSRSEEHGASIHLDHRYEAGDDVRRTQITSAPQDKKGADSPLPEEEVAPEARVRGYRFLRKARTPSPGPEGPTSPHGRGEAVAMSRSRDEASDSDFATPESLLARLPGDRPLAYLLVYRSAVLSGDTQAIETLAAALRKRGIGSLVLGVSSLKDPEAVAVVRRAIQARRPGIIVTTTAFSSRDDESFVLDQAGCPILQAIPVGSPQEAWEASPRGLSAADLAMQIALPEFDGRIAAGPISFKSEEPVDPSLAFSRRIQAPDMGGIDAVADTAAAWVRLACTPRRERRLALVLSDYPARGGRAGFAVGLDTPASACAILDLLEQAGYAAGRSFTADELMPLLTQSGASFDIPLSCYRAWLDTLPAEQRIAIDERWGQPENDPIFADGAFHFRAVRAGNTLVALQPDRGHGLDRKGFYHDPECPPSHGYLAFYCGLRTIERIHALVHLGTHGTTEWLPGKAVALSNACWPRLAIGDVPVIYPFIVDDPGEAAPAKRRIGAVTIGHLTPQTAEAGLHGEAGALRELVEEFSSAQVLHPGRAELVAREILDRARTSGLAAACGVEDRMAMDEALTCLDAHLCDLGEVTIRDGLHVFGHAPDGFETCSTGEREGLLKALDGRFVVPGPSGSPSRGQTNVLPTGRNLATLDPRAIPTRAATELGHRAAAEVVRRHLQEEGDWPRRIVMDLWASPTLRTGGEDIAHALALMGVRPTWDHASTRVTGFEIVPQPLMDRPRADVTLRVSGAFRDTFPDQIALLDQAARAVAALDEDDEWNELAAARRRGEAMSRVFGSAPGTYGAGVSTQALDGEWATRHDLGRTYLDGTSHAFGSGGEARADQSFPQRVEQAEAFVHVSDVAERDILDGDSAADAIGGFAAAARTLGASPAVYSLDTSRPQQPKARTLREDVDRLVRGRLTNPRWIAGQLRHGWRGAAEVAQGVDALLAFAATTDAVPSETLDLVFTALIGDESTWTRIEAANPPAAQAIRNRLADARRRGLWASRLNSVAAFFDDGRKEAAE